MAQDMQQSADTLTKAQHMSDEARNELFAIAARIEALAESEPRAFSLALGALATHCRFTAGASLAKALDEAFPKR
ncbi:hypothetical protein ACJ41P_10410 [Azospirillum argentinense]|uniref:Uncharacterized protein n=1 Tax=Azospirillum argentinense TaxID=2970906 RepID=A0ABW8V574_9PROT